MAEKYDPFASDSSSLDDNVILNPTPADDNKAELADTKKQGNDSSDETSSFFLAVTKGKKFYSIDCTKNRKRKANEDDAEEDEETQLDEVKESKPVFDFSEEAILLHTKEKDAGLIETGFLDGGEIPDSDDDGQNKCEKEDEQGCSKYAKLEEKFQQRRKLRKINDKLDDKKEGTESPKDEESLDEDFSAEELDTDEVFDELMLLDSDSNSTPPSTSRNDLIN